MTPANLELARDLPSDLPTDLTADQRRAGMDWIVWDGVLASSMATLTGGVFLTGFALMLGASETAIGVLMGLPRFSALMQPLGSYFVERWRLRKAISVWVFGPARVLWLAVVMLPLLGYVGGASQVGLALLFGVAVLSSAMAGFAAVSWLAWMADLVPPDRRGSYFAKRTMLAGAFAALVGLLAGKFIDLWKADFGRDDPRGLLIVFSVGLVCGLASWYTLIRCPEPPVRADGETERPPFWSMLREAWLERNFRMTLYATAILSFGVWIASPFFSVYMIKQMQLSYGLMSFFAASSALGSLVMVRLWGRLTDHFGSHPVMSACINGASLLPLLWIFSAGGSWWPILLANILGGASWSGYMLAQMNLVFKITPEERKSVYIGMFYALDALPTLIAPLLGGLFLERTAHWGLNLGGWHFINYHVLFLASGCTRFAATPCLRRIREPEARDVKHMMRVLSHFRSLNPLLGIQYYGSWVLEITVTGTRRAAVAVKRTAGKVLSRGGSQDTPEGD